MKSAFFKLFLALAGPVIAAAPLEAAETRLPVLDAMLPQLGLGYQLAKGREAAACVEGSGKVSGSYQTEAYLNRPLKTDELIRLLAGEQGPLITQGFASSLMARINLFDQAPQSKAVNLWYFVRVSGRRSSLPLDSLKLTNVGASAAQSGTSLYETCGNHFIQEIEFGGMLLINVSLIFDHYEHARTVERDTGFPSAPIQVLIDRLANLEADYRTKLKIVIAANQIGGDPLQLLNIFGQSQPSLSCIPSDLSLCRTRLDRLTEYASAPDQFNAQIRRASTHPLDPLNAAPLAVKLMPYAEAKVPKLNADAREKNLASLLASRRDIIDRRHGLSSHKKAIGEYLTQTLSEPERDRLSGLLAKIERNLKLADQTLDHCFDDVQVCKRALGDYDKKYEAYAGSEVTRDKLYGDYCLSTFNSLEELRTLEALKRILPAEATCMQQQESLENLKALELSDQNLQNIEPLRSATNVVELRLANNRIQHIAALQGMPNLRRLDLRQNLVRTIDLAVWGQLEKVNLDSNQLTDVGVWQQTQLNEVSLIDNPIVNPDELRRQLKTRVSDVYLFPRDVCTRERLRLFQAGMINEEIYLVMDQVNFIPDSPSNPLDVDNWVLCDVAYTHIERF